MTTRRLDRTTCEATFRRLDDYLDPRLAAHETRLIEEHLHQCEACGREFVFEASVIEAVRQPSPVFPARPRAVLADQALTATAPELEVLIAQQADPQARVPPPEQGPRQHPVGKCGG